MMKLPTLFLLLLMLSGCQQMKKLYPIAGAGGGSAIGSLGGPGTAAAGGMLGYAAGKELAIDYTLQTAPDLTRVPALELLQKGDVEGIAAELIKAQLEKSQKSWGDKVLDEVNGLVRLCLWVGGLGFLVFVVIIPFLHKHGIRSITTKLHKELDERVEKLKK